MWNAVCHRGLVGFLLILHSGRYKAHFCCILSCSRSLFYLGPVSLASHLVLSRLLSSTARWGNLSTDEGVTVAIRGSRAHRNTRFPSAVEWDSDACCCCHPALSSALPCLTRCPSVAEWTADHSCSWLLPFDGLSSQDAHREVFVPVCMLGKCSAT